MALHLLSIGQRNTSFGTFRAWIIWKGLICVTGVGGEIIEQIGALTVDMQSAKNHPNSRKWFCKCWYVNQQWFTRKERCFASHKLMCVARWYKLRDRKRIASRDGHAPLFSNAHQCESMRITAYIRAYICANIYSAFAATAWPSLIARLEVSPKVEVRTQRWRGWPHRLRG